MARPAIEVPVRHPEVARPGGIGIVLLAVIFWVFFMGGAVFPLAAVAGPIVAALAGMAWILPVLLGPLLLGTAAKLRAGEDGITVRSLGRKRFISYGDVVDHRVERDRIGLRLRSGKNFYVQIVERRGKALVPLRHDDHAIAALIQEGIAAAQRAREPSREETELARRARAPRAWIDAVMREASDRPEYRASPPDREALAKLCADPSADPTVRAASALVLRKLGLRVEEREALKGAAASTAHPKVRVALEAAADEEVAEEEVASAVMRVE